MKRCLGFYSSLLDVRSASGTSLPEASPLRSARPATTALGPPRKVVVGTVIFGPYGNYPGLEERMKELSGFVDAMADEAAKKYPGRGLDLAVLPETTVTSTHGAGVESGRSRFKAAFSTCFGALARRHKTYLVVPLDLVEESASGTGLLQRRRAARPHRERSRAFTAKCTPWPCSAMMTWKTASRRGMPSPSLIATSASWASRSAGTSCSTTAGNGSPTKAPRSSSGPAQSPATALPAARAGQHRYFVVSSCWRNNATVYEPTGMVAARVETPGKVLVHELDLSYAVLGWSAPLREGKAFSDKYGERAGYHYERQEDLGMFWSNDPALTIGAMVQSLGLEEIDAQIVRNRRLQDAARGSAAP